MKRFISIAALLLTLHASAWWNGSWDKRFAITSEATLVDEDLGVYAYPLSAAPACFWSNVDSAGADVRMADEAGSEIPMHLVYFDSVSETGMVFFKDTGSTSVDVTWYVYYDNSGATAPASDSTYGSEAVWADYAAVYMLDVAYVDGVTPTPDVAGNGYDLDNDVGLASQAVSDGITADWPAYDMAGGDIIYGGISPITDWPITISAWCEPDNTTDQMRPTALGYTGATQPIASILFHGNVDDYIKSSFGGNTGSYSNGAAASTYSANTWYSAVVTRDANSGTSTTYFNGGNSGTDTTTLTTPSNLNTVAVGGWKANTNLSYTDGKVMNVRYYAGVRSADFVSTEYAMESNPGTFWTTGSEETAPTSAGHPWFYRRR